MTAMQTLEIRRSDRNSDSSDESNSHDPELEARFREQLSRSYDESVQVEDKDRDGSRSGNGVLAKEVDNEDEEVYEFRLFKKPSGPEISNRSHHIFQKIALRSPTPESGEPGFLKPRRPDNYYFTGDANAELVEQYQRAAVSGAEILEGLKARWVWSLLVIRPISTYISRSRVMSYLGGSQLLNRLGQPTPRAIIYSLRAIVVGRSAAERRDVLPFGRNWQTNLQRKWQLGRVK